MSSPEIQAIEKLAPRKFHRIFTTPATDEHGPLKVSYAIAGVDVGEGEDVPNVLVCGGMFGTRYIAPWFDWLGETERVRMILIDRPGFGGSTQVDLADRISTFLEVVPLLLTHLKIKHIALASHSSGTIYALNLLTYHPELLYPTHPSMTFFSPWVHQSRTSVSFLLLASMLPNVLLNYWNKIINFIVVQAQPTFAVSGSSFTLVTSAFKDKMKSIREREEEGRKCLDGYGVSLEVKEELDKTVFKFAFAENTVGANDEARLCLKSVAGTTWGACEDYEECVKALAETWEKRVQEGGRPLRVDIFLPEEDIMVGEKGMRYFEKCWGPQKRGSGIKVETVRWGGTDHESVISVTKGVVGRMLSVVKALRTADMMMEES